MLFKMIDYATFHVACPDLPGQSQDPTLIGVGRGRLSAVIAWPLGPIVAILLRSWRAKFTKHSIWKYHVRSELALL